MFSPGTRRPRITSFNTLQVCFRHADQDQKFVAEVHARMPVLLRPDQFDAWLDGSAGQVGPVRAMFRHRG